jgi:hypothetical protein
VFWVISVYFNIRNTLPKFFTFLPGHPVYYIAVTGLYVLTDISMMTFETVKYIDRVSCNSEYLRNTTDTYTDHWLVNAAVASCRPNLNTRFHVCVLCMHKAQISVRRSENLNVTLKCFPQSHQASSLLVPSISFPFQITAYCPIQYHSTSTDSSPYPNTSSQQQCLEAR